MAGLRRAAKRDANHAEIVKALRAIGVKVLDLGAVGNGCPDLLVGCQGRLTLLEIKDGNKPPSARSLTDDQRVFHREWLADGLPVFTVESVESAINAARNGGMWE